MGLSHKNLSNFRVKAILQGFLYNSNVNSKYSGAFKTQIFIIFIGIVLITGFMVPIYSDEVGYFILNTGLFRQEGKIVNLFPQCASQWLSDIPVVYYPGAFLYTLIYPSNNPLFLRASGILVFLFWLIASWFLCLHLFKKNRSKTIYFWALSVAIMFLGVVPYTTILARPESLMSLCLVCFAVFACTYNMPVKMKVKDVLLVGLFLSLYSLFLYAHPKAVFFIPYVLICGIFFARSGGWLGWGVITCLTLISGTSIFLSLSTIKCDGSIFVTNMFSSYLVDHTLAWKDPLKFIVLMANNFFSAINSISNRVTISNHYQSGWLAGAEIDLMAAAIVNFFLVGLVKVYFVIIFALSLFFLFNIRKIANRPGIVILSFSLLLSLSLSMSFYSPSAWNFYTVSLVLAVLSICSVMLYSVTLGNLYGVFLIQLLNSTTMNITLISLVIFFSVNLPSIYKVFLSGDPVKMGQPVSAPIIPSKYIVEDINLLKKKCDFPQKATRLVIDQGSYSAFDLIKQPIFSLYIYSSYGIDIKDKRKFLVDLDSSGVLTRCNYLAPELQKIAFKSHDYCCISRAMLTGF